MLNKRMKNIREIYKQDNTLLALECLYKSQQPRRIEERTLRAVVKNG